VPELTSVPTIEIDGAPLSEGSAASLHELLVDDHLQRPDTFELRFFDPARTILGDVRARVGSAVRISAGGLDDSTPQLLLSGEVTAIEAEYDENGGTLVLRGYDLSHRLTRGRRTKTWQNAKYSDIAQEIAQAASLQAGTIDDSGAVLEYVAQANQSDWDFLWDMAREIDFEVAVVDGKLDFRKPADASGAPSGGDYDSSNPLQLVLGGRLLRFRPRVSGAGQVTGVEVRGWSVADKDKVVGTADAGTTSVHALPDDPASLAGRFGDAKYVSVDAGPADQRAAERLAARIKEQIGSTFAEATGTARGDPRLKAGSAISVSTVGQTFEGSYTLTHTRHAFDLVNGYQTHLEVSGRQERSLLGLASSSQSAGSGGGGGGRQLGVVIALVDDVDDPQQLGRVRLRFPWMDDNYVSDWARVAVLGGGKARGAAWLPETDDEVLVAFEFGDVRRPYVLGGLWNGKDAPPAYATDQGKQKARSLVSRIGHSLVMRDGDDNATVELTSADGKLAIVLDQSNGEIKVTASETAKVTISAGGDLTISAQGQLKLQGQMGAELSSPAQVKVKGSMLQLNPPG
jgi:phage protein D/phage baseplate assembly protein gpV